jgi:hypothetical protein
MVLALSALGVEAASLSQRHFLGYEAYKADIELHAAEAPPPVAPSLWCITFLTVLFFSVYLVVIFVRACRRAATCAHEFVLPMLMKAADALTLVPMLCILMITARQRATQLNPAVGDPQPWAQTSMYVLVAALITRVILIVGEEAFATDGVRGGKLSLEGSPGSSDDKERQCDQQGCRELSLLDRVLLIGHALAALTLYGCCATIVVAVMVMERPYSLETPALTPMMKCLMILTVLYLLQYLFLEISGFAGSGTYRCPGIEQDMPQPAMIPSPYGEEDSPQWQRRMQRRSEDEAYIKIEPVTLQFIPMFCVLLVGISLRAVQLNLQPDKWACIAMYVTTVAIVIQAIAVPIFKYVLTPGDVAEVAKVQEDPSCFPSSRKSVDDQRQSDLRMKILTISWSLIMVCLYVGIAGTLVTIFAMEAEPLDVVWPEKKIGLLEEFLRHLEKSRHLMENEALHALSTAAIPPISTAMRCTMLLTVLYFGVFLGVLVGRATCGPARKQAAFVNEAEEDLQAATDKLDAAQEALDERQKRQKQDPELVDPMDESESRDLYELKEQEKKAKEQLQEQRAELCRAQASEAHVREGVQRSLAFVPMLCVLMIAVRMRAMQLHIRDPQPWAQITMYVASSAVTTQVLASICWACFVRADDFALSCAEVGLIGKVAAIVILAVRYIAAIALYMAMIALVVALTSMQQGMSIAAY